MVSVIRDILFFFQDIKMLCLKFLLCILLVWGCKNFIKLSRFFSTSRCFVFFKNKCIYLFIYFWLRWVFVAARGLSLVVASAGYSWLRCAGFSLRWLLLLRSTGSRRAGIQQLWHMGSVVVARGLQSIGSVVVAHGLSCSVACGIFPDQGSIPCPLHWQADS